MTRFAFASVLVLAGISTSAPGFEVEAVIRRIDAEQRVAVVFANGQERTVAVAADAAIQDAQGARLQGGLVAPELQAGTTVTLRVEPVAGRPTILAIRLGDRAPGAAGDNDPRRPATGQSSVGFNPLSEMTADDRYQQEDGGLYGHGRNEPPPALADAARQATAMIEPLDTAGRPAADGRIGLISLSMSNATQEFSRFKQLADADARKSPRVTVVDCAQGGQTMARWADATAPCWTEAFRRLQAAGVAPAQVQVAWVKLANAGPSGTLEQHGRQLERDTRRVLALMRERFPNLRVVYLGSRIYGGYGTGRLNPEPYAYEGAFVVRWLVLGQLGPTGDLVSATAGNAAPAPLLLWGPYFWADGLTPRVSDALTWERSDFADDGTHPSPSGRQKVAEQLLSFFQTNPFARTWYLEERGSPDR